MHLLIIGAVAGRIDPVAQVVTVRAPERATQTITYGKLIVATGAKPLLPVVPGIEHVHPLHTMKDSFKVHEKVASGEVRRAIVVGAGYIGVEMADALTHRGVEVELADAEFAGVLGTQIVKVFDLAIARTGLLEREADAAGFSPQTTAARPYDHKGYYPGAEQLEIRVTGDVLTGRLLGAQIAGHG